MLAKLIDHLSVKKNRDLACASLGMASLLAGQKALALGLFAKGFAGLEQEWRRVNAFEGTGEERWRHAVAFYEATHQDPVNRALHVVGIPMILGGAAGLLAFRPLGPFWFASASSFTAGWVLNIIGHGVFEKKAPAFADDPLSFVAGPVWDVGQLKRLVTGGAPAPAVEHQGRNGAAREVVAATA
ncbi:MAG: DUF962 domain-containing protein [Planctomycetes bacterium]|nr:DUF962 domain-containing protein [Planctomycetota bacterium]